MLRPAAVRQVASLPTSQHQRSQRLSDCPPNPPRLEAALADDLAAMRGRAWYVRSSVPLEGTVTVAGAKNSTTKLMIAACLAEGASELDNVHDIADARITAAMLEAVGAGVAVESGRAVIDGSTLASPRVGLAYSGLNRMPILCLPVLLHRFGEARVPVVGGDGIGLRPVDFHRDALMAMGAHVEVDDSGITASGALHGADITLPYPSVGATETVLLAAVRAQGRTILHNAAVEPEIQELIQFLQRMGAIIERNRRSQLHHRRSAPPRSRPTAHRRRPGRGVLLSGRGNRYTGQGRCRGLRPGSYVTCDRAASTARRDGTDRP